MFSTQGFRGAGTTVLISGADAAIDVDDLRKFTRYENCALLILR